MNCEVNRENPYQTPQSDPIERDPSYKASDRKAWVDSLVWGIVIPVFCLIYILVIFSLGVETTMLLLLSAVYIIGAVVAVRLVYRWAGVRD